MNDIMRLPQNPVVHYSSGNARVCIAATEHAIFPIIVFTDRRGDVHVIELAGGDILELAVSLTIVAEADTSQAAQWLLHVTHANAEAP